MTEITVVLEPPLPDIEVTVSEVGLVGPRGEGVPAGGTTAQVLAKASDDDFDTEWADQAGGGGGAVVSIDSDGTLVVDDTTVELATDAQLSAEATARAAADTALDSRVDTLEAEQGGSRPPSGGAGGVLSGSYPNPGFAVDMATQAELDAEATARSNADAAEAIARDAAISAAVTALIGGAPSLLDTFAEIAAQLATDESATAALTTAVAGKQPLDADLTAIAALTTTAFGRGLLELANAPALRSAAALGTAATSNTGDFDAAGAAAAAQAASQPLDSDLTAIAALTTTSFGRSLLTQADAAAARTTLGVTSGAGVAGMVPVRNLPSGIYTPAFPATSSSTNNLPLGVVQAMPFVPGRSCTLDRIGIEVTTLGASSVFRAALYADDGTGYPGALINEFTASAQFSGASTGVKENTISQAVTAGTLYWLAFVQQGSTTALFRAASTPLWGSVGAASAAATNSNRFGWAMSSVTGAFPDPFSTTKDTNVQSPVPNLILRAA